MTIGIALMQKGEPMSDLISRQAAIDATWFEPSYTDPLNVLTEVRDRLKALPSAQPEPKRGKWERHYCKDGNPDGWQCDKCKEWYYFGQTLPNFCPNCGAKMDEEMEG